MVGSIERFAQRERERESKQARRKAVERTIHSLSLRKLAPPDCLSVGQLVFFSAHPTRIQSLTPPASGFFFSLNAPHPHRAGRETLHCASRNRSTGDAGDPDQLT
mmetsp:Transcript_13127/g.25811  ORF Transcript_13127/g.25811 Transcript_13127/m.25811 type:complete len:105 (-) Transcript_13127:220-534(-)